MSPSTQSITQRIKKSNHRSNRMHPAPIPHGWGPAWVTDVVGGHAAQHGFDAIAVAVVDEAGAGRAAHGRQAVLGAPLGA